MEEQEELIAKALATLETYPPDDDQRPSTVAFFPPDSRSFFRGNRDGYVKLAIAALRAAGGEQQKFDKTAPWFVTEDWDWSLGGFLHDESAHVYQPQRRSRQRIFLGNAVGFSFLIAILGCIVVGAITISRWIF